MELNKMPTESISIAQRIQEFGLVGYGWLLLISLWAGTAKYLSSLNGKKPTFMGWFVETTISGFVGVIAAMICQYYQLDFLLTAAITGIAAHNGTRSLFLLSQSIRKNSGFIADALDKSGDEEKRKLLYRKGDNND